MSIRAEVMRRLLRIYILGVYIYICMYTSVQTTINSSDLTVEPHMAAKTWLQEPCSWVVMCDIKADWTVLPVRSRVAAYCKGG